MSTWLCKSLRGIGIVSIASGLVGAGAFIQTFRDNTESRRVIVPNLEKAVVRIEESVKILPKMAEDINEIKLEIGINSATSRVALSDDELWKGEQWDHACAEEMN